MNKPLAEMFRYNRWPSRHSFGPAPGSATSSLDLPIPGLVGGEDTARRLLLHVIGGHQTFVLRTRGRQNEAELKRDSDWPGFDS